MCIISCKKSPPHLCDPPRVRESLDSGVGEQDHGFCYINSFDFRSVGNRSGSSRSTWSLQESSELGNLSNWTNWSLGVLQEPPRQCPIPPRDTNEFTLIEFLYNANFWFYVLSSFLKCIYTYIPCVCIIYTKTRDLWRSSFGVFDHFYQRRSFPQLPYRPTVPVYTKVYQWESL